MTTNTGGDVRCAAALRDDFDRATRYDAERAWRFVIDLIDFDDQATEQIEAELGDCPHCLRGFAFNLGGLLSGVLVKRHGRDKARTAAQMMLDEVLNCPDLLDPGAH